MSSKKDIVIVIPSNIVANTFIYSGAMKTLEKKFNVTYLCAPIVKDLVFPSFELVGLSSLKNRILRELDIHLWYFALFVYWARQGIPDANTFKSLKLPRSHRTIYRLFARTHLAWLILWLDRNLFFRRDYNIDNYLSKIRPSLLIAPATALDSYSHMVLRSARHMKIPTLMIASHWDFFSKKGLLRLKSDQVYVWGEDMKIMAQSDKTVCKDSIRIVGAPHFDKYIGKQNFNRGLARSQFGLRLESKVLLFAGASLPYDELTIIKILNNMIESHSNDIYIIYRPHPKAWKRQQKEHVDITTLKKVVFDAVGHEGYATEKHYQNLMAAIDGIISPFSTMVLEAALCGKPAFCLGFADGINDWNFSEVNSSEHIKLLKGRHWLTVCINKEQLESHFESFLVNLNAGPFSQEVRKEVKQTVYYDDEPYADRLYRCIKQDFLI